MASPLACAKAPCKSCPYRKDVPSGLWDRSEYEKLPAYDEPTWAQPRAVFMCHQQDGRLCAGWVAAHGSGLLALRLEASHGRLDLKTWSYSSPVPVFSSGREACDHGLQGVEAPDAAAQAAIRRLVGKQRRRGR